MKVLECKPDVGGFSECGVVFSGLDHDVAGDIGGSSHAFPKQLLDAFRPFASTICSMRKTEELTTRIRIPSS